MKKKLLAVSLLLLSVNVSAQDEAVTYDDETMIVDLHQACWNRRLFKECDLSSYGIPAKLVYSDSRTNSVGAYAYYDIQSQALIRRVTYTCESYSSGSYDCSKWNGATYSGVEYSNQATLTKTFDGAGVLNVSFRPNYMARIDKIHFHNGVPTALNSSLSGAAAILRSAYKGVLRNLEAFKTEIAKSHRGHLDRLNNALRDGITLTEAKDSKSGKPLYSVVDWRVQENARLIVVFGTVLNELLTDYDDVARLKTSIDAMRTLVSQLRDSYGWNRGLAGNVSKASSSLLEVVRLELQELASIKMAMGSGDFKIYLDLLNITRNLQAKVDASRSGDMKAQREIFDMLDLWNGKLWQDEMGRLMNAGPDFKNLVVPKLSMLLYSIESIADLSDQDFIIPDRTALTK